MAKNLKKRLYNWIPTRLTEDQFEEFFLPHLSQAKRGPAPKISLFKTFNYILHFIYTGVQWEALPIGKDDNNKPEIHYTRIFCKYQQWNEDGSLVKSFEHSVLRLKEHDLLEASVLHGDGTCTVAKKGGDNIGRNGHKHHKGDKIVAITDRKGNVVSPFVTAPGNRNETVLLKDSLLHLKRVAKFIDLDLRGTVMSLDSGYDSIANRKMIFNRGMIPNIKEIERYRLSTKRGRKRIYNEDIFEERFETVERTFAWEDKFKRLLLRFERKSINHFGLKLIAYTLINLRHFC